MPQAVFTKEFNKCLRDLLKAGKKGKDAVQKSKAAIADAGTSGEIQNLSRTKHGESRLPDAEKYDLGDGYRLVIQVVDSVRQIRAFLFAGTHDEADHWLDRHKDYRWVRKESDQTLEFVQVTKGEPNPPPASMDLESPPSLLQVPLLRDLTDADWEELSIPEAVVAYARRITSEEWEQDSSGICDHLVVISENHDMASLILDLLNHAHEREWGALRARIQLHLLQSRIASPSEAGEAMLAPINSEIFMSWDDSDGLPVQEEWADWMLFLHPSQKDLATRELSGPARIRGVSGSGKTCVMIHRARTLARRYKKNVLLVTLTESMRRLLDVLCDHLCGVERSLIKTFTMSALAKETIRSLHPKSDLWYTPTNRHWVQEELHQAIKFVRSQEGFEKSQLKNLDDRALADFLEQELSYIRSRLLPNDYDKYLTRAFKRRGRSQPLGETGRRLCLDVLRKWDASLQKYHKLDHEAVVQCAITLLMDKVESDDWQFRCVLVDEVQDLSQLEVTLLALLHAGNGSFVKDIPDGLFLVGDGAQSIYPRGFSLGSMGVNITGRSHTFKKNYRNTMEIASAAFGLIQSFEFADVDEDNLQPPVRPDFATRHGEKPVIVKCRNLQEEGEFVAGRIAELMVDSSPIAPGQICVIAANNPVRDAMASALNRKRIATSQLRQDVAMDSEAVKISTIESAKGHEFSAVFIAGVVDGVIPQVGTDKENIGREASRLYVAMTRARDLLHLSYSSDNGVFVPSPFLVAIQQDCTELEYRDGTLLSPKY